MRWVKMILMFKKKMLIRVEFRFVKLKNIFFGHDNVLQVLHAVLALQNLHHHRFRFALVVLCTPLCACMPMDTGEGSLPGGRHEIGPTLCEGCERTGTFVNASPWKPLCRRAAPIARVVSLWDVH